MVGPCGKDGRSINSRNPSQI